MLGLVRILMSGLMVVGLTVLSQEPARAQGVPNATPQGQPSAASSKKQQDRKDVDEAREKFKQEEQQLDAMRREQRDAETALRAATTNLKKVRDQVQLRLERELKLTQALAAEAGAQKSFDDTKRPVLEKLQSKPEYQASLRAAEQARARMKDLRQDLGRTEDERARLLSRETLLTLEPGKLEHAAYDTDPKTKDAHDKLLESQQNVAALREKVKEAVENDSDVTAAQKSLDQAQETAQAAKTGVEKQERQVEQAKHQLEREAQQYQFDVAKEDAAKRKATQAQRGNMRGRGRPRRFGT